MRRSQSIFLTLFLTCASLTAFAASTITGTVTNRTTNKPSAGDEVVLIRLAQGMQEAAHTTTDAHGHFTLDLPDNGIHLIRVNHEKANYFRPAPPGTQSVDVDVYNSAAHVKGVSLEADVLRLQTDPSGNTLNVVENFWIKNDSNPPMTQFSPQPFDFYLPAGAVVEGSAALGPGSMPIKAAPVPLADKGHYTFIFPLRPGETRFQVSYHLPYSGKLDLVPHLAQPTANLVFLMPKSMTFTPAPGNPYQPVTQETSAQTYLARNVNAKSTLAFTLTGTGQLPRDQDNNAADNSSANSNAAASGGQSIASTEDTRPGSGLGNPLDPNDTRDPWAKYKWWILAGLLLILAAASGVVLRKPATATAGGPTPEPTPSPSGHRERLLLSLKEELFNLETEHLKGNLPEADYLAQKAALETVMRRALTEPTPAASNETTTLS